MKGTKKIIRYVWEMKFHENIRSYNDFAHYTDINCTSTAASADGNNKKRNSYKCDKRELRNIIIKRKINWNNICTKKKEKGLKAHKNQMQN